MENIVLFFYSTTLISYSYVSDYYLFLYIKHIYASKIQYIVKD